MVISFPLIAGIIAAALHVISGPDHLAAVTPFAIEREKKAWKVGLFWGIGHLSGMLFIGVLFLLFKDLIPFEKIASHSEKFVGLILIILGLWLFFRIFKEQQNHKHTHVHSQNNPIVHQHPHVHFEERQHNHMHPNIKHGLLASLSFGFVHGLAGFVHFLLFLPVLGFTSKISSVQYIVGFGIGTLLAMTSFAMVIGHIATFSKQDHNENFFKGVRLAGALFAIIIGVYWLLAN